MGRGGSSEAGEGSSLLLSRADQESRSLVEVWKTPESSAPAGKRGRQGGGFWARGGEGTRTKAWTLARLTLYSHREDGTKV